MSAATRASQHQECSICFDALCKQPVSCLFLPNGRRSCLHCFHTECIRNFSSCPNCTIRFNQILSMPNPVQNPTEWFKFNDTDGDGKLSYEEVVESLKAQLPLNWARIECDADSLWPRWDKDRNGTITLEEFMDPNQGIIVYLKQHYAPLATPIIPDITKDKTSWFKHWDEDKSGHLDKSEVCRALIKTFRLFRVDKDTVINMVDMIWPMFDFDGSGEIDLKEFAAPDGLGDTIIAQLLMDRR